MTEFFRHCPGCGRRFHIKTESKQMIHMEREKGPTRDRYRSGGVVSSDTRPFPGSYALILREGTPAVIDVEEFQYMYKCSHCNHEWQEKRIEEHREH